MSICRLFLWPFGGSLYGEQLAWLGPYVCGLVALEAFYNLSSIELKEWEVRVPNALKVYECIYLD